MKPFGSGIKWTLRWTSLITFAVLIALAGNAHASPPPTPQAATCTPQALSGSAPQVSLCWSNTPAPSGWTLTGNLVYRAPCTGAVTGTTQTDGSIVGACSIAPATSTFVLIDTLTTPSTIYTDAQSVLVPGSSWTYYVEETASCSTCNTAASAPSSMVSVKIATAAIVIPPPGGLTLIAKNKTTSGSKETLAASWKDKTGLLTGYFLWGGGRLLKSGSAASSISWTGNAVTAPSLDVCDDAAFCLGVFF